MTADAGPPVRLVVVGGGEANEDVTEAAPKRLSSQARFAATLDDGIVATLKATERAVAQPAWEAVYLAWATQLEGFLMVRLRHPDDAREAVSETFLRAMDRISALRTTALRGLKSWMFQIAYRVAIDRTRARRRVVCLAEPEERADLLLDGLEDRVVSAEEAAEVRRAFNQLNVDEREVLWLRICADLKAEDAAAVLGRKPGTVRMQQSRALAALGRRVDL